MIKFLINQRKYNKVMEHLEGVANRKQTNSILNAVAKEGVAIAKDKYVGLGVNVGRTNAKNNECKVYARGKGLLYLEYGTGLVGKGTYPDNTKLPKETRKFVVLGTPQITSGWEYYYFNPETKEYGGWWYGKGYGQFTQGQRAGAQMYYVSQELRKKVREIVLSKIKEKEKFDVSVS